MVRLAFALGLLAVGISHAYAQVGLGTDEDGNPIVYRERFELKGGEIAHQAGEWPLPSGWTSKNIVKQSNGAHLVWWRRKGGDFTNHTDPSTYYPRKAGEGECNAALVANDAQAQAYLISPPWDLRADKVVNPALTFLYAANQRQEADELRLKYRLSNEGDWEDVVDANNRPLTWKRQEEWRREVVLVKDLLDRKQVPPSKRGAVQFAFWGLLHRGHGVCIDDVMIVDLGAKEITVRSATYQGLSGAVGEGTKLNEVSLFSLNITPGVGVFRLKKFALEYAGGNVDDIEKLWLYRTSAPFFSAQESDKLCELTLTANTVQTLNWHGTEDARNQFASGQHYFWVVADIKPDGSNERLKRKIKFKMPKASVSFAFKNGTAEHHDHYVYPDADLVPQLDLTIYKTLYKTGFESADSNGWTLQANGGSNQGGWRTGELSSTQPDLALTPAMAFAGSRVLATAKLGNDGRLVGFVERGQVRAAEYQTPIATKNFSDVRMKLRYSLGLDPKAEFAVRVRPEGEDWKEVWTAKNRKTSNPWNLLPLSLTAYATRKDQIEIGFQIESQDVSLNSGYWGAFIDEVQVLGDYVRSDVGVSFIEPPAGFDFGTSAQVKIKIKNYGAEQVAGPVQVRISLSNGQEKVESVNGPFAVNAEKEHIITGLDMTPSATGDNLIVITASTELAQDDDPINNGLTTRFYAFPTFEVSENHHYPKDPLRRMLHWFPTPTDQQLKTSWLLDNVANLLGEKREKCKNPPFSAFVWTTGKDKCLRQEKSVLTGPILNLTGAQNKQLEITYALHGAKMHIEYRTEGNSTNWLKLNKESSSFSQRWYETNQSWNANTPEGTYVTAKVQLPSSLTGKVQFRVVFESVGEPALGVAINQLRVHAMQPDFAVSLDPETLCSSSLDLNTAGHVKFKIRNNGHVPSAQFQCPVEISVYEQVLAMGKFPPEDYKTLNTLAKCEALGSLRLHGTKYSTQPIQAIAMNQEVEIDPTPTNSVSALWNYSATYYVVRVRIFPERVPGIVDGDLSNNEIVVAVMPYKMPHSVLKNVHAINKTMYVQTDPTPQAPLTIQEWYGRQTLANGGVGVRYPQIGWSKVRSFFIEEFRQEDGQPASTAHFAAKPTWATAAQAPQSAQYTRSQKIRMKVHATRFTDKNGFDTQSPPTTATEPKDVMSYEEEITIKRNNSKCSVQSITFHNQVPDQEGGGLQAQRGVLYACHQDAGERITAKLIATQNERVPANTYQLHLYANGKAIDGSPFTITRDVEVGTLVELEIPTAKIPAGYSRIDAWLAAKDNAAEQCQPTTLVYQLYRWQAPNPMTVLVRNTLDPQDFYQLEYKDGKYADVLNYGTKSMELYVVPTERVNYQWYKGSIDAAGSFTERVGSGSRVPLEAATAAYELSYEMQGLNTCKGRTPKIVVRADDLALLNFAGPGGTDGVCPDKQKNGKIEVIVHNNSRTIYPEGTALQFKLTLPDHTVKTLPDKKLMEPLAGNSSVSMELDDLSNLTPGLKKFKLELLSINGKPDGNKANDILEQDVRIYQRPTVHFDRNDPGKDPVEIRKRYSVHSQEVLDPECSADAVSFVWYSRKDFDGAETLLNHPHRSYLIKGIPDDAYRLQVANEVGCTADATVRFIQTDFGVTGIASPKNACLLEENQENAVINLQNFGSKNLKSGTQAEVKLWVGAELIAQETVTLSEQLMPDEILSYTLRTPMLKERLKGKTEVDIKAEAKLKVLEDLDQINDARSVKIVSYGYPDMAVQMSDKPGSTPSIPLDDAQTIVLYDPSRMFEIQGVSLERYAWDFQPESQATQMQIDTEKRVSLPNEKSKEASRDKRGSGFYYAVAENEYVCRVTKKFELKFEAIDIAIAQKVETPQDACAFAEDMHLKVVLQNKSSVPIPMMLPTDPPEPTRLKFTVRDVDVNDLGVEKIESSLLLSADWPVDGKIEHTITIPHDKLKKSDEEIEYKFETVVAFADAQWDEYDREKLNNKDVSIVKDRADVKFNSISLKDKRNKQDAWNEDDNTAHPYVYEPHAPDGQPNQVALKANVTEIPNKPYRYSWTFDPTVLDMTSGGVQGKGEGLFEGSGRVCLTISTEDGACPRTKCGIIQSDMADMQISIVNEPTSICKDRYNADAGLPVAVVLKNVGAKNFTVAANPSVTLTYNVFMEGQSEPINATPYTHKFSLQNSAVLQSGGTQTLTNLSPIAGLGRIGKYVLKFTFTLEGVVDGNVSNNSWNHQFDIYDAPKLDMTLPGMAGWGEEAYYMPEAKIGIPDPSEVQKYSSYAWRRLSESNPTWEGGSDVTSHITSPNRSYAQIAEPGTYMLRFEDAKGCAGFATKKVRFPGYIELVERAAFASPKSACSLSAGEPVAIQVRNNGKEVYAKRDIPMEVEMDNPAGGSPFTKRIAVPLAADLAPGESVVLKTGAVFDLSQVNDYTLRATIGADDPDREAQDAEHTTVRQPGEMVISHLYTPLVPDVRALARAALDAIEPGLHLDRIPRKRGDAPVVFDLDGLVPGMPLSPYQTDGLEFRWTAGSWTAGENPKQSLTQFNATGDYKVTVGIRYQQENLTCTAESAPVHLAYASSYALSTVTAPMEGSCLKDEDTLPMVVKAQVSLAEADEPLAAGSTIRMSYSIEPDGGSAAPASATEEYTLPAALSAGDAPFEYAFDAKPQLAPGRYRVKVRSLFVDRFGERFASPESSVDLLVPRVPVFKFPKPLEEPEESPFKLRAPSLPEGDTYTYSWNSGAYTAPTIDVKLSGTYELTVTTGANCSHTESVSVQFLVPVRWAVKGKGRVAFSLLDGSGNPVRQLENDARVRANSRVRVEAKPAEGYEMNSVIVNGSRQTIQREGYDAIHDIVELTRFDIGFRPKKDHDQPTAVESEQLRHAHAVSPFDGTLTVLGAGDAARYEVVSQMGVLIRAGANAEGADRIEVPIPSVADGLYLVRLYDRAGGVRTLRAMRVRR